MNHPPVPPNCPYFQESEGKTIFVTPWSPIPGGPIFAVVVNELVPGKVIIAGVARSAWLEEAARIVSEPVGGTEAAAFTKAALNADMWAKWGKQK